MPRILIVEDDRQVGLLLRHSLEAAGYEVATCGRDAVLAALSAGRRPDLVLLDDVPAEASLSPAGAPRPPVLLLAEPRPGPPPTVRRGGIDAYLEKPVGFPELLARIRALLRGGPEAAPLAFADIVLDPDALRVNRAGRAVHLGPTEFRLLKMFLEAPGRVFSRDEIRARVWGEAAIDARTVDVHIGRLRKALARGRSRDPVRTVRGSGYALDDPARAEGRRRPA